MAEVRTSTSYNHVVQTPRIGGCTGAFFNLFDWNSKRFASTKRLPAERLGDKSTLGVRSKSFCDDCPRAERVARGRSPVRTDERGHRGAVTDDDMASAKATPGLVARLMGLESLPESKHHHHHHHHRRSRSCSGSDSASHSERESRREKLVLRDLLKQEHEPFENYCIAEEVRNGVGEQQHKSVRHVEKQRVMRKAAAAPHTPIIKSGSLVPYVDSPTGGSCRSVYALPYVHRGGEKSPFLARLHPGSSVLQPSKCHNQMVASSPKTKKKKRASRFLEAAVKILEEISDNEQQQQGMGCPDIADQFAPSSGFDLLHCRSMSKIWNGSDDTDSVTSRSNRSLMSRGSFSFRDSQRSDRICRDLFETSLSSRAQSVSPPPPPRRRSIHRTQEASVGDFKQAPSPKTMNSTSRFRRHSDTTAISDHGSDLFTSDEDSLTDQLVRLALRHEDADDHLRHHESRRPIRLPRTRVRSSELAKPRSHSQKLHPQTDEVKLSIRIKREKQSQALLSSNMPNAPPILKRSRRKNRHGSTKLSSGHSRSPHLERRNHRHHNATDFTDSEHGSQEQTLGDDIALQVDSRNDGHEVVDDVNAGKLYETISDSDLLHGHDEKDELGRDHFVVDMADCGDPAPQEELILGMDDLHWDDRMAVQQRENFPSRARYSEIRASGESVQSICGAALDVEDVCNVDDGSSPSPQQFAGEMCSEGDETSAPVLMNVFVGKPLRLDVDMGETSPVSVLESPFGDSEVCTTSESSVAEPERQEEAAGKFVIDLERTTEVVTSLTADEHECCEEIEAVVCSPPRDSTTPVDRVRQALLDISAFRSLDHDRAVAAIASPQTEKTFVREVLSAAQLLSSPGRSPNWYERDLAVDPSLFEKLEDGDANSGFSCESGGMWRCDRKLLFDCVNEAFSQNVRHFKDPQPWLRRPVLRSRSVRQKLVEEVQDKINGWRELASHAIDTLIDIDMSTRSGTWTDFGEDVADVGSEIESMVWQVMVEEVVQELAGQSSSLH